MAEKSLTKVTIKTQEIGPKPINMEDLKDNVEFANRQVDKGIINSNAGSALLLRDNGDAALISGKYSQYKLNNSGQAIEISMQSNTITNRKIINADEIVINSHKLNPQLYELADMRQVLNDKGIVGNLTVLGTVLVKAWEPILQRHVLIRRQIRIPLFSPLLNVSITPENLAVDSDITKEIEQMSKGGENND